MQFSMHYLLRLDVLMKELGEPTRESAVTKLIHEAFEALPVEKRRLPKGWNYGDPGFRGAKPGKRQVGET